MRFLFVFIICFICITSLLAQKTSVNPFAVIDKKALQLPDSLTKTTTGIASYINSNFSSDDEKVRAIFVWVASNLEYDVDNMYAINFYESQQDKIDKAIKTRKGICENYAAVFNDICNKCSIRSYIVNGYTKQKGFTDYIPHSWCAVFVDSAWYLFDPTWGSGYINNGKFYKSINNTYFKAQPVMFIEDHMPFDYLWQFLNYPVTNAEFYTNNTAENKSKPYFNYTDSLDFYEHSSNIDQLTAEARRIETNGIKNSMIFDRLQHIKIEIENEKINQQNLRQSAMADLYNAAASDYNLSVKYLNDFIDYRNHQFKPEKADDETKAMLDSVSSRIESSGKNISQIKDVNSAANQKLIDQLKDAIADIEKHEQEQRDWLNEYLSKSKSKRKSMFYEKKITWFGVPLN